MSRTKMLMDQLIGLKARLVESEAMYEKLNMTHAHRLAALQTEAKKGKNFYQLQAKEVIDAAGGVDGVKKQAKTDDEAFDFLIDTMEKLIKEYHKNGYSEVGEANTTALQDWVDNNTGKGRAFTSVHSMIVQDLRSDPEVQSLLKAYENGGYKDADEKAMAAYVKPLVKKKFPKYGGELWTIVNDLLGINY